MIALCCTLNCAKNNPTANKKTSPGSSAPRSAPAAPASSPGGGESPTPEPQPAPTHVYVGAKPDACTYRYRTSDHPQRDITRLTLLCAPYQGMARLGRTWLGKVSERQAGHMVFPLTQGQCARVFAAAQNNVAGWEVRVFDPRNKLIGGTKAHAGYAIVNPEAALCVDHTGDYRAEIHAQQGAGLAAVEVWTLPPP